MTEEIKDPFCDEDNPVEIKYENVAAAAKRIAGAIVYTPCVRLHMSDDFGVELFMKLEILQYTGCFKERGVRNTLILLSDEQKRLGAVTASTGNQAQAFAYHCQLMDIPCILVLPTNASINKIMKCERFAAKIVFHGESLREAKAQALKLARDKKMVYIDGYDHPNVVEGQGSVGIEVLKQVPNVDVIICSVGGGSILTGLVVAVKHLKPDTEVYGVETDKTCSMTESLKKNDRIMLNIDFTVADGLAVQKVGVNTFHTLKVLQANKMVVVKEDWVARTIMHVMEEEKYILEGAGATALAAVMAGLIPDLKGKKVAVIGTGGNIDAAVLARATERGMASEGRLLKLQVTVPNRPGGITSLCNGLNDLEAFIRDIQPERTWIKADIFCLVLDMVIETRGWDHVKDVVDFIKKNYTEYSIVDMRESSARSSSLPRGPCMAPNTPCAR